MTRWDPGCRLIFMPDKYINPKTIKLDYPNYRLRWVYECGKFLTPENMGPKTYFIWIKALKQQHFY